MNHPDVGLGGGARALSRSTVTGATSIVAVKATAGIEADPSTRGTLAAVASESASARRGEVLLAAFGARRLVALRSTETVRGWCDTDERRRDSGARSHGVRDHALTCGSQVDKLSAG